MKTKIIKGKYNSIKCVVPEDTYFIIKYKNKEIKGGGLIDTGWSDLEDGIHSISYYMSTGLVIDIPNYFIKYIHFVEASQSLFSNNIVYHFVYVKGLLYNNTVICYKISLKENKKINLKIGDVEVYKEKYTDSIFWKKAENIKRLCE